MFTIVRLPVTKRETLLALIAVCFLSLPLFSADAPPAPVPTSITTAKRVFISNSPGTTVPANFGGNERIYNEFYAAMKAWGRYELVTDPSDADLILEISFNSSLSGVGGSSGSGPISSYSAELRLVMLDAKMRVPLWWLSEAVTPKASFGRRAEPIDSAFARSMTTLMDNFKKVASNPVANTHK